MTQEHKIEIDAKCAQYKCSLDCRYSKKQQLYSNWELTSARGVSHIQQDDIHKFMKLKNTFQIIFIYVTDTDKKWLCKWLWLHVQVTPPCWQQGATNAHKKTRYVKRDTDYILHSPPVPCLSHVRPTVLLSGLNNVYQNVFIQTVPSFEVHASTF